MDESGLKWMSEEHSLEQKLKKYGSALEEEDEESAPPCSLQLTMLSPPPPSAVPQLLLSHSMNIDAVKSVVGLGNDSEELNAKSDDAVRTVDFGKDSHTELSVKHVRSSECGESVLNECDVSAEKLEPIDVDVEEFTDPIDVDVEEKLEFTEPVDVEEKIEFAEPIDVDVEDKMELTKPLVVDVEEKIEFTEPIDVDVGEKIDGDVEVVDKMMVEENCKRVRVSGNPDQGASGGGGADECGMGKAITVRGESPEGNQARCESLEDFLDLLEAAEMSTPATSTDTNFLKAAKDRGLTFNRPRWWPSEEVIARDW